MLQYINYHNTSYEVVYARQLSCLTWNPSLWVIYSSLDNLSCHTSLMVWPPTGDCTRSLLDCPSRWYSGHWCVRVLQETPPADDCPGQACTAPPTGLARTPHTLTRPRGPVQGWGSSPPPPLVPPATPTLQHPQGTDTHSVIAALFVANISFYHWNKINRTYSTRTSSLKPLMTVLAVGPCQQFIRYLIEKELLSLVLIKKTKVKNC